MGTPDFVTALRRHVGHAPLWLAGATAVIRDAAGEQILLVQRADNGWWTPVTGIVDPGEHPADTAAREAGEEAGVRIRVDRLAQVGVTRMVTFANGDQAQFLDHTFACTYLSGTPAPVDGECVDVRWFPAGDLPEMPGHMAARIAAALSPEQRTRIDGGSSQGGGGELRRPAT